MLISGMELVKRLQDVLDLMGKPVQRIVIEADVDSVARVYVQYYFDVPAETLADVLKEPPVAVREVDAVAVDQDGGVVWHNG